MSAFDASHWERLFSDRAQQALPVMELPPGLRDDSPEVRRILGLAAFFEQRGRDVFFAKSREARDPGQALCFARSANEEGMQARMLMELIGESEASPPIGIIAVAERFVTRQRPIVEQTLISLLVEAMGIAIYDMVAECLGPGRASAVLQSIVDDERVRADLLREILVAAVAEHSPRAIRRLRRIRTAIVGVFVGVHALLHRRYLRPVGIISARQVRGRMLSEIEHALRGIPELAVPAVR